MERHICKYAPVIVIIIIRGTEKEETNKNQNIKYTTHFQSELTFRTFAFFKRFFLEKTVFICFFFRKVRLNLNWRLFSAPKQAKRD